MSTDERKSIMVPDAEWNAFKAAADAKGTSMRVAIRRFIAEYCADAPNLPANSVELRAVNKLEPAMVVSTSSMNLKEFRAQLAPGKWVIEERTTTPYRPPARRGRPRRSE